MDEYQTKSFEIILRIGHLVLAAMWLVLTSLRKTKCGNFVQKIQIEKVTRKYSRGSSKGWQYIKSSSKR